MRRQKNITDFIFLRLNIGSLNSTQGKSARVNSENRAADFPQVFLIVQKPKSKRFLKEKISRAKFIG